MNRRYHIMFDGIPYETGMSQTLYGQMDESAKLDEVIQKGFLHQDRAEHAKRILQTVSAKLTDEYGRVHSAIKNARAKINALPEDAA